MFVGVVARAKQNKQTDQTTTLCVQEVEIYLERWEVLGALVVVDVGRAHQHNQPAPTGISQSKAKRVQEYVVAGRCLLMWLV